MIGTPLYMAPEQIQSAGPPSAAADVYALGCVLFACVTGVPPLRSENLMALLQQVMTVPPPRLREVQPALPAQADLLDPLLGRMLKKRPAERPLDAAALLGELEALLSALAPQTAKPGVCGQEVAFAALELVTALLVLPAPDCAPNRTAPTNELAGAAGAELCVRSDGALLWIFPASRINWAGDQVAVAVAVAQQLLVNHKAAAALIVTGHRPILSRDRPDPLRSQLDELHAALGRAAELGSGALGGQLALSRLSGELLDGAFPVTPVLAGERSDETVAYTLRADAQRVDTISPRLQAQLGRLLPIVGRDRDLAVLTGILSQVTEDSQARAVLVVGPIGIGKTRLRQELFARLRPRGETEDAAIDVLMSRAEFLNSRVEGSLLAALFGLPSPVTAGDVEALGARLRSACARRTQVLILEDLQWADGLSVRLVDELLLELSDQPLFVLALGRPEVLQRFPNLWGVRRIQHVQLPALTRRASERLVTAALGADVAPELIARLVEQADGRPLFLEALIRDAIRKGAAAPLPETVLAMLEAQLGRLEPGAQRVLQAASVFGTRFPLGGVQQLLLPLQAAGETARWLEILTAQEIVLRQKESHYAGEVEFSFGSSLLCAAASALLTAAGRACWQTAAAEYLQGRGGSARLA